MEFHISRALRERLALDDLLFSYTGNVVFANVAASRRLAQGLNEAREAQTGEPPTTDSMVNAGALFAMGLIDELNHALVARYREEVDPAVLKEALRWFQSQAGPEATERLLLVFSDQFPNTTIYRGETTAAEWLKGSEDGLPNREAALEELLLLWLSNLNPVFAPFRELFDDSTLKSSTVYESSTATLPEFFSTRPPVSAEAGSLLDALRAPMLASPDSITGQLDYIREHWAQYLGEDLKRVLVAIDTLREEDIAIWMRFNPPGPDWYRHGAPGRGSEGFVGDEYVGFEDDWITTPEGKRVRRYATDYQAPLSEYEAFSADQAWMPNVVLMAKSTYVWLEQLSKKYQRHIHRLDQVPDEELRLLAERGITALWLIGLWERSTASRTIKHLRGHSDAVASAYSLKSYDIAEDLGGNQAYEHLREHAARAGLRLASDMVPNHMGIDSDWVLEHPDWFVFRWESPFPVYQFNGPDLSSDPAVEIKIEDHYYDQTDAAVVFRIRHHREGATRYMYHGNDGTTFAWNDTAQLDYSKAFVREQVMQAILHVARKFPIIRFDAAMVLAKRHVQRLWFPLPGAGGSIPSRAENAMSQEEFDALMPLEFWREVVDRVAVEVPGTLLLAEAFWLLEGYFVRTLGMHRVYNSAFMNMLRDEENAKYRSYLKKTIEFDPDIMKRYVNFMSNPDERTTIDQFGDGDKCFGVATMLATLPGLPMFGHGQIEGYTERYGMEYKAAKMEEWPREDLVARHQREIAPLLKQRYIFAESENFVLYDFWHEHGGVDENVFAYSNRLGSERSIVLYNNSYGSTRGTIHISAASMDKGSGELRQRSVSQGLALPGVGDVILAYRDRTLGLEYLRRATDFEQYGMTVSLRGYEYAVLLDWRELRSTAEQPWGELCDALHGAGVSSVDAALTELRLRPVHEALREALHCDLLAALAGSSASLNPRPPASTVDASTNGGSSQPAEEAELFPGLLDKGAVFFVRGAAALGAELQDARGEAPASAVEELRTLGPALTRVPLLERHFSEAWPPSVRSILPSNEPGGALERTWAPAVAYVLVRSLAEATREIEISAANVFDRLHLRAALAAIFSGLGVKGEDSWRSAARVRVLLTFGAAPVDATLSSAEFWADSDVRWLAGVNETDGVTWVNKEAFEELLVWLQLRPLIEADGRAAPRGENGLNQVRLIEAGVAAAREALDAAGYQVNGLIERLRPASAPPAATGERPQSGAARASKPEPAKLEETVPAEKQ